jgi:GGDEF-like domain
VRGGGGMTVAIQNGRLYRRLVDKAQLLEATFQIHRQLGETAIAELGLEGVMRELARLTDRRLRLEQTNVPPFELDVSPDDTEADANPDEPVALAVPVDAHGAEAGTITAYGKRPVSELESNALAHGATVIALELLKHEAALAVESRLRRELLEELLPATGEPSPTQLVRARRLGFNLEAPHRLIVAELQNDEAGDLQAISRSLRHRHADAPLWLLDGDRLVAATVDDITVARRVGESIYAAAPTPSAISVGISSSSRNFPTTYREATAAAGLARVGATAPLAVECEALGPLKFMLDVTDPSHARTLVHDQLSLSASTTRSTRHSYSRRCRLTSMRVATTRRSPLGATFTRAPSNIGSAESRN